MISKNNKILFLYDFSRKFGNGHFQRCKYFSEVFQNLLDPTLLILKKKFFLTNKHFFRFIVIDSYSINYKEEIKIKKNCQTLITIDDFVRKHFASNLVINYSPIAKKNFYINKGNKFLLGEKYNFIKKVKKGKIFREKKFNLFFYFGLKNRKKNYKYDNF